jgi:hypothetical protein
MTDTNEVRRYAEAIMTLIKEDQDAGQVPGDVCSWDELDDSVDTEDYYRQAQLPAGTPDAIGLRNAVNDEVSRRLAASQGGPWGVTWTTPDGPSAGHLLSVGGHDVRAMVITGLAPDSSL